MLLLAVWGLLLIAVFAAGARRSATAPAKPPAAAQSAVERGRYLVTVAGCNDCHTPTKMGANGPEPLPPAAKS
jgi:mono/diheme cytochrome c family protein